MPFTVQIGLEHYRIVGPDGEEGELADFDSPAFLVIGSDTYIAYLEPEADENDDIEEDWKPEDQTAPIPACVYKLGAEQPTTFESDMVFDVEEEEEEEEEEGVEDDEAATD